MFDTTLQTIIIGRLYFQGLGYTPIFFRYIYKYFYYFTRLVINLIILRKIFLILISTFILDFIFKIYTHLIYPFRLFTKCLIQIYLASILVLSQE